jgi:hypothetical protein
MAARQDFIDIMKEKYTEGMSDIKEIALTEKMVELIFKTGNMKSRIFCYMRKRNIKSVLEFMNRKFYVGKWDGSGSDQDGRMPSNTGATCCRLIEKIQKDLAKEGKKELKKVPITTYEWRLV